MIKHLKGDATCPQATGHRILCHVVSNRGGWGKGFVLAISKRWKGPEQAYRQWYNTGENFKLGQVQFVEAENWLTVANMLCQAGYRGRSNPVPLRYDSLRECLRRVAKEASRLDASIHMPKGIGSGLAGGNFEKIVKIVEEEVCKRGLDVVTYDYN